MSMNRKGLAAVRVAKALADPTRFELLLRIAASGEICCGDLVTLFAVSQATVSHHLKILTDAGLVTARRAGQFTYFRIRPGALEEHGRTLLSAFGKGRRAGRREAR
jgi:ArsR family transcriptional regulator, arsenate/arsenite/antimonite-responsive transcriptional repressor